MVNYLLQVVVVAAGAYAHDQTLSHFLIFRRVLLCPYVSLPSIAFAVVVPPALDKTFQTLFEEITNDFKEEAASS